MQTLIIYDSTGYIISQIQGEPLPREPQGVPFIWLDMPIGKRILITDGIGVDVTVTPNVAILEDIPKTDIEIADKRIDELESGLMMLMFPM